jgi:hypothetical protein
VLDFTSRSPDEAQVTSDGGDETARRYRFQSTYAATLCCSLLDETDDVVEILCEQHEDVLMKHTDGTFTGVQIKTRMSDQPVWKTADTEVQSAFVRFCRLEAEFPGRFRAFVFLTDHPLHAQQNGQSIPYVLEAVRTQSSLIGLPSAVARSVERLAAAAGCTVDIAIATLSKTRASDDLPKLSDMEVRLVGALTDLWPGADEASYVAVRRAAQFLAAECFRASSLAHHDILPAYLIATRGLAVVEPTLRLDAKRIHRARLLDILESGLNQTLPLVGDPQALAEPGEGSLSLLFAKLDAGGFSAVSCNSAADLRDKADYLGIVWTKKHGREIGLQRYGHVRSLVLSDAGRAFETARAKPEPFGIGMLDALRLRFERRRTDGSRLYDCSDEHLEGFAYSLTSQCEVQWSIGRPWEVA